MIRALILAALCAAPASGQKADEVRRGDIAIKVHVSGTVTLADVFRLNATFEGRADKIWTSTGVWAKPDQDLGLLLNKEFAALMDVPSTTKKEVLTDRWSTVYQPRRIRCPKDCYILKSFARSKQWVKPRAILFEAAEHLRMIGRVKPEDSHLVRDGMVLEYWAKQNPAKHFQTPIAHYILDIQGEKAQPGGTFTMDSVMRPGRFFPPGTDWEGLIVPLKKDNVLIAPTDALIRLGDAVYLPVKVSTGLTTPEWTELTAGVEEKRPILDLSDAQLRQAQRHKMDADIALPSQSPDQATPPSSQDAKKPRNGADELREPDSNQSADPYSE
jgi:hypothetical protein